MAAVASHVIEGHVSRGFEPVRDAFEENFARRAELGGACCAFYRGEKVVDLWGGIRNEVTGEPWERDTMVVVHSATKGLAAMTLALAHSRGWLDYEERIAIVEEQLDADKAPPPVRSALEAKGTIVVLESVLENGRTTYEGQVKTKAGKKLGMELDADGKPVKK